MPIHHAKINESMSQQKPQTTQHLMQSSIDEKTTKKHNPIYVQLVNAPSTALLTLCGLFGMTSRHQKTVLWLMFKR